MRTFFRSWSAALVLLAAATGTYSAITHDYVAMYINVLYMIIGTVCYCVIRRSADMRDGSLRTARGRRWYRIISGKRS